VIALITELETGIVAWWRCISFGC